MVWAHGGGSWSPRPTGGSVPNTGSAGGPSGSEGAPRPLAESPPLSLSQGHCH